MKASKRAAWWIIALDIALINMSMILAYWVRYELQWFRDVSYYHPITAYIPFSIMFTLLMLVTFWMDRVYRQWRGPWAKQLLVLRKSLMALFVIGFSMVDICLPSSLITFINEPTAA